jgi:hypothetical protein
LPKTQVAVRHGIAVPSGVREYLARFGLLAIIPPRQCSPFA